MSTFIYKRYDQESLNKQYNNRLQVPDHPVHVEMWETMSRQTEKEFPVNKDISYGEQPREKLDIYPSSKTGSKTLIFIHGGYWRNFDKSLFQFIANAFHQYDITIVIITYPLAPAASIDQIVLSCRKAINWVQGNIKKYNGNPEQIYIAGHSAGGHLAVMMMTNDEMFPPFVVKGVCSMSGLFNLIPVQLSDVNETLQMSEAVALRNSPVQLQPAFSCPLLLAVGADETDEYKSQSEELYNNWKEKIPIQLLQLNGLNHYSIVEDLLNPESLLHQKMKEMMGL